MKINRKDILIYFLFLLLTLTFFYRFLSMEQIFAFRDLSRYFYPLRYLMVEQVKSGQLPLWNPYIFCGFPLLATLQVGVFYPLSIIYYVLPFNLAFNYYIILHYFLAACFMYSLTRYYKLGRSSSFFAGLIFAFSGYLSSVSNMITSLSSVIWLPLILLFFDRLMRKKSFLNFSILGLLLALQFLGGEPTIIYLTVWFLVFYALVFSQKSWRAILADLGGLLLSGLVAVGLIAVQLLPFVELLLLSDRVVRTAYELVTMWSFPPRELLTFIFPFFFGNLSQFGSYTETLLGKTHQAWLISPYLGIFPLIFVFLSFRRERAKPLFFTATALISLLLAFGKYMPIYKVLYNLVPGISFIRYPVKYLFLTTFCLSILAGLGMEEIMRIFDFAKEKFKKTSMVFIPIFIFIISFTILGYLFIQRIFDIFAQKYPQNIPFYFFYLLARIMEFNLQSLLALSAYFFILIILFFIASRGQVKRGIFLGIIILVTIADLFSNNSSMNISIASSSLSEIPENYRILLKENGLYRFLYTPEMEKENIVIYGENYAAALANSKDNFAANRHIPYHLFDFYGYESVKPLRFFKFYHQEFRNEKIKENARYLDLFNIKYLVTTQEVELKHFKLLRHKTKYAQDVYLYQNQKVFPRAYLLDRAFRPNLKIGKVKIMKYLPTEIEINASLNEPGSLFLSEAYYPGWKAYVDGKKSQIKLANDLFRSVSLSPGKHQVKFVYDPLLFKIGAAISLFTLLGLGMCFIFFGRKR